MFLRIRIALVKLFAFFIFDKNKRKVWRKQTINALVKQQVADSKWGVSYSVFDGEELLESSIKSIRSEVDYVNVVYQTKSWYGNPAAESLVPYLQKLKNDGLIDELIEYIPNMKLKPGRQERVKRNMGLKAARKVGVTYFMTMDCDEYYETDDLKFAKEFIVKNQITHAYCSVVNYGPLPTQRLIYESGCNVQIFSKLKWNSRLWPNSKVIALIDPTRQMNHDWFGRNKYYFLPRIVLHHMTFVRKDINKKAINSAGAHVFEKEPIEQQFIGKDFIECKNIFNIDCSKW